MRFFNIQRIPWGFKKAVRRVLYFGYSNYCNCCGSNIRKFVPGGKDNDVILKHSIAGAGFHSDDACPVCHAGYRQRLLMVYLDSRLQKKRPLSLLHIAPEQPLYYYIFSHKNITYHYGDLFPEKYNYYCRNPEKIDITNISYSESSFDIVIASHILEHIPDDKQAMKEIFRVLKRGGWAVLQVPVSWETSHTIEYKGINTAEERLKLYGQKDHVRIYGSDYTTRLEDAGFSVELFRPEVYNKKWALDEKEILIIGHKK